MEKRINTIVKSEKPPKNTYVLWLKEQGDKLVLRHFTKGIWSDIGTPGIGETPEVEVVPNQLKVADIYKIQTLWENGEISCGDWVDITESYIEAINNVQPVSGSRRWVLTNYSTVAPVGASSAKYLIQVLDPVSQSFSGKGYFPIESGINANGEDVTTLSACFNFTITKIKTNSSDNNNIYQTALRGNKTNTWIVTHFEWLKTNSVYNFDPLRITTTSEFDPSLYVPIMWFNDEYSEWEASRISLEQQGSDYYNTYIPLDNIINSTIIITKFSPIYNYDCSIVNSTIKNSFIAGTTGISESTIIDSIVANATIYNSKLKSCIYAGAENLYRKKIGDENDDYTITNETPIIELSNSNLCGIFFTPCGVQVRPYYDNTSDTFWNRRQTTLSNFPLFDLSAGSTHIDEDGNTTTNYWWLGYSSYLDEYFSQDWVEDFQSKYADTPIQLYTDTMSIVDSSVLDSTDYVIENIPLPFYRYFKGLATDGVTLLIENV